VKKLMVQPYKKPGEESYKIKDGRQEMAAVLM